MKDLCSNFRKKNLHSLMPTNLVLLDTLCFNKFLKVQSPIGKGKCRNVLPLFVKSVRALEDSLQIDQALGRTL